MPSEKKTAPEPVKKIVLSFLEQHRGAAVSGEKIAAAAGVSRAAVWKAVKKLREEGYPVRAATHRGYLLPADSDRMSAEGLRALCSFLPPQAVHFFKTVDSTNLAAKRLAVAGVREALVVAETQTAGRGRKGRDFFSPEGTGVYMSFLTRPPFDLSGSVRITAAAAVAAARAVEAEAGVSCGIKWVNDLYLLFPDGKTPPKKTGGILTEAITDFETGEIQSVIIGIGINIRPPAGGFPAELSAGALSEQSGKKRVSRSRLAVGIAAELHRLLRSPEMPGVMEEYRRRSFILGRQVTLSGGPVPPGLRTGAGSGSPSFSSDEEKEEALPGGSAGGPSAGAPFRDAEREPAAILQKEGETAAPIPKKEGEAAECGAHRSARQETEALTALAEDIDENGGLVVRLKDGSRRVLTSGEISLRLSGPDAGPADPSDLEP